MSYDAGDRGIRELKEEIDAERPMRFAEMFAPTTAVRVIKAAPAMTRVRVCRLDEYRDMSVRMDVATEVEIERVSCKTSVAGELAHVRFSGYSSDMRRCVYLLCLAVLACTTARPQTAPAALPSGVWRIRMDVDSVPTRRASGEPVFGIVDFTAGIQKIDLQHSISRTLPVGAHISLDGGNYKIVLGDSASYDEKIVMIGRRVGPDSIVGKWSETILCCSATGTFSLWRDKARR